MLDPLELSRLFSCAQQPVLGTDGARILFSNPRAAAAFGFDPTGREVQELIPPEVFGCEAESYVCAVRLCGRAASVSVSKQAEITLLFVRFTEETQPAMYLTRGFFSNLRNSMTGLKLAVDRCCRTDAAESENREKYIAVLYHYYYSLLRSVTQLDSADQLERGEMLFTPVRTELVALCADIADTVAVLCAERGTAVQFTTAEGELYAVVDPDRIEQLLLNLISNSLQHTKPGGKITITLGQSGSRITLSVDDDGDGIPPENLPDAFSFPADPEEPGAAGGGLGLGLYIASGIAQLHGGVLLIESRTDRGTRVRVMLPADGEPAPKFKTPETAYRVEGAGKVLTALADALPSACYGPKYED